MLIATSPRLCSDQEKNSTEEVDSPVEVDCISSNCISNNCVGTRGELVKEEQSWLMQSAQPAYEFTTDTITTKPPREVYHPQKTKDVFKESVKPKLTQPDTSSDSQQARGIQGEEVLDDLHPAKDPSKELPHYLKTDVQKELGDLLPSKTVESNDSPLIARKVLSGALQHLLKLPDVSSVHANPSQRPSAQSKDYAGHSPVSAPMSEKLHPLGTVRLIETMKCPIIRTFQSEGSWKPSGSDHTATLHSEGTPSSPSTVTGQFMSSSHTDRVQTKSSRIDVVNLEEFCSLAETPDVQSEEDLQSDGHCGSFHTAKDQREDMIILPKTTADQSREHGDFSNAASSPTMKSCASEMAQSDQIKNPFNQQRAVMDDLTETRPAMSCYSQEHDESLKADAECPQATKAPGDYKDCTEDPTRTLATKFAESFNAEQASTCNSEQMYLSCGSHWSDRVNKVAVEGDLMASIVKGKKEKGALLLCDLKQEQFFTF